VIAVAGRKREPTDADGPLLRAAYRRASQIRDEPGPVRRRDRWASFLAVAAAAVAESLLREAVIGAAGLSSVLAVVFGVMTGDLAWAVPMGASGVAGFVLVCWATARQWPFGRQWGVLLSVLMVQVGLLMALWRAD
jgi:hypothetical protein